MGDRSDISGAGTVGVGGRLRIAPVAPPVSKETEDENDDDDEGRLSALVKRGRLAQRTIGSRDGSGRTLETFLLAVGFGNQCCSVPVVLDMLDENWDSGTNQNKKADHAAFPIGRHPEKD
jgi:hypothetical protein